jgi:cyclase
MLKNRLIVCLLLRNGNIVQSKGFKRYQRLGNPVTIVERLTNWMSDELVYLDISPDDVYDLRRDDLGVPNRRSIQDIIRDVAKCCFMPLTFGGKIRSLEDIYARVTSGADKVSINTQAFDRPEFITEAAREFGSQCIVVSMDAKSTGPGAWEIYKRGGEIATGRGAVEWAREAEARGAGEILLNSIDRDGSATGYDLELVRAVVRAVKIPVIALGGVGEWRHFKEGLEAGASAVAAANIFHYSENSVYNARKYLYEQGVNVREPMFFFQDQPTDLLV